MMQLPKDVVLHPELRMFLEVEPNGIQMTAFVALVNGLKPAMDLWIKPAHWSAFCQLVEYFGLHYHINAFVDRTAKELDTLPAEVTNTTRAALAKSLDGNAAAHVFISKDLVLLQEAVAYGWYPLLIDDYLVQKHVADFVPFGHTLGYPTCCVEFFHQRNNWKSDNTYYAAYQRTWSEAHIFSNGLMRHSAFSLVSHMPCSFHCSNSIAAAHQLYGLIETLDKPYADEIKSRLESPFLCLSELRIYRFEGTLVAVNCIEYTDVEPINPTSPTDALARSLAQGNRCMLEGNIVRVFKDNRQISAYLARGDQYGPECPFFVQSSG